MNEGIWCNSWKKFPEFRRKHGGPLVMLHAHISLRFLCSQYVMQLYDSHNFLQYGVIKFSVKTKKRFPERKPMVRVFTVSNDRTSYGIH